MCPQTGTFHGSVDRITGRGRAIIEAEDVLTDEAELPESPAEINLGEVPEKANGRIVGETVEFAYGGGNYGMLTEDRWITDNYIQQMQARVDVDMEQIQVDDLQLSDAPQLDDAESQLNPVNDEFSKSSDSEEVQNISEVFRGKIDRISGSGNAIVNQYDIRPLHRTEKQPNGGGQINLGPLPPETAGEEVLFTYEGGTFGICLDIQYIDEEYIREMAESHGFDSIEVKPDDILFAEYFLSPPPDGSIGDIQYNQFLAKLSPAKDEELSCLAVVEGPIVQNEIPVPVMVTDIHPTYIEAKGALPELKDKLPEIGKTITTTTEPQHELGTPAVYEGDYTFPVFLEDVEYPSGESLEVEITELKNTHLIGEAAFSADDFDVIHISGDEIPEEQRQSQNRVIKRGVPIDIKPVPADATTTTAVVVTDEGPDALVGRWNIQEKVGPVDITRGDEIEVEIRSVDRDSCTAYYGRLPVQVEFDTAVPPELEKERVSVSIREVNPDKAIAKPRWITETQAQLEVRVVGHAADNAIAIREGRSVRIPNPSVVESGDRILVGVSEPKDDNVVNATVSARPVFQETKEPYLIRLPRIQGNVVQISGTPAVVDHLPDVDTAMTLGVAEVNEDHIVPTVTALPEAHLPDEGAYVLAAPQEVADEMVVGVGEELPLKLPLFTVPWGDIITARVLEHRSESLLGVFADINDDTSGQLSPVYEHVQSAGLALQQTEYCDATGHLSEAVQSCPSEFPGLERLLASHLTMIQAILAIRDNTELDQTADALVQEADRLDEFEEAGDTAVEVGAFLRAREAEMRAAERLLTVLNEVGTDSQTKFQAIAQGVSAKPPVVKATEHLETAEDLVVGTSFEKQILSLGIQSLIQQFKQTFPGIVDELQSFIYSGDDSDWFPYLLPDKIFEQTDATLFDSVTGSDTWQRPSVPETMGIIPVNDVSGDEVISTQYTETSRSESESSTDARSQRFSGSDSGTSESNQTEVQKSLDSATDDESSATEPGGSQTVTEEEGPESVTPETDSSGPSNKIETDNQIYDVENTSEIETETSSEEETKPSASKSEDAESRVPDEQLSIPDESFRLRKLREEAEAEASENPEREHTETTGSRYRRSPAIRKYAIERADGNCELCGAVAPFVKDDGEPFLEVHHVEELSEGGSDHPALVAAVCPNCHREIHYGKHGEDLNERLQKRLEEGLGDVGAEDE
jgi:5-methylcytosine-specific restriction endonuclease McrA